MLEHCRIVSRNLDAARRFYAATCRPLGLSILEADDGGFVVGRADTGAVIRVQSAGGGHHEDRPETRPAYVALEAPDDMSVRAFYRAALEAGGREHLLGYPAPQSTPDMGFRYYATRVTDPDGNCVECGWRH